MVKRPPELGRARSGRRSHWRGVDGIRGAGNDNHLRTLCLDRRFEGLPQGKSELDRFLVTAGRVVYELSHGGSELRNCLALPVLVDGYGALSNRLRPPNS